MSSAFRNVNAFIPEDTFGFDHSGEKILIVVVRVNQVHVHDERGEDFDLVEEIDSRFVNGRVYTCCATSLLSRVRFSLKEITGISVSTLPSSLSNLLTVSYLFPRALFLLRQNFDSKRFAPRRSRNPICRSMKM